MSTKSKRRGSRRARHERIVQGGPQSGERPTADGEVVGEIMTALLSAITFGAVEGPASGRSPRSAEASHPKPA